MPYSHRPGRSPSFRCSRLLLLLLLPAGLACGKKASGERAQPPGSGDTSAPDAVPTPDVLPAVSGAPDAPAAEATPVRPTLPAAPPVAADVRCVPGDVEGPPPELPDGALVLFRTHPAAGPDSGFRVLADGILETLGPDGSWTAGKRYEGEQLAALRKAVQEARLDGLSAAYRREAAGDPAGLVWLLARGADGPRAVAYDEPCFVPEVHELMVLLLEQFD